MKFYINKNIKAVIAVAVLIFLGAGCTENTVQINTNQPLDQASQQNINPNEETQGRIKQLNIAASREELCIPGSYNSPTSQELDYDKQISKDEFVIYLRQALNTYLANSYVQCSGSGCGNGLINGIHYRDSVLDLGELQNIDVDYLQSKFIVLSTDIAPGGGESIIILFKDRPDTVFYSWVYRYQNEGYDLRSFKVYDLERNDAPNISEIQKTYINQLCDQSFGVSSVVDTTNFSVPKNIPAPISAPMPTHYCCKYCTAGKACGDSCISRSYTCHKAPGCACDSN